MATLKVIKERALMERPEIIIDWVAGKLSQMKCHSIEGIDVSCFNTGNIPATLIEEYCDSHNIPCYAVCLDVITLSLSYVQLLKFEENR